MYFIFSEYKDFQAFALVGPNRENLVFSPLTGLSLNNQLFMLEKRKIILTNLWLSSLLFIPNFLYIKSHYPPGVDQLLGVYQYSKVASKHW